jgi:hypothetical protein
MSDGVPPDAADDAAWRARAERAVAAAASTGSKRPRALYGPAPRRPTRRVHFVRAAGAA